MKKQLWDGWKIESKVGNGEFGEVYSAVKYNGDLIQKCAIKHISLPITKTEVDKLLKEGVIKSEDEAIHYYNKLIKNFKDEFAIMKKFNKNHYIINCYDYFQEEKTDQPGIDFYMQMEMVENINSYFKDKENKSNYIVQMGHDIACALEACSKENIIHRDIKPDNIFIGEDHKFKLGDFGAAIVGKNIITNIAGTYNYMSPEVYNKQPVTKSTDLYSLGMVMYQFLNGGKLPFVDENVDINKALLKRIDGEKIPVILGIDEELMNIILKCCSYKLEDRYSSATDLKNALTSYMEGLTKKNVDSKVINKTINIYDTYLANLDDDTLKIISANDGVVPNRKKIFLTKLKTFFSKKEIFTKNIKSNLINKGIKNFKLTKTSKIIITIIIMLLTFLLILLYSDSKKCKVGYISRFGICVNGYYTCEKGYTLNKNNKCSKTIKSIDATKSYSCKKGYTYNGGSCVKNDTKEARYEYQCQTGFTLQDNQCVKEIGSAATANYSCPTGYVYYQNRCFTISDVLPSTTYSCPSKYTLVGNKCTLTEYNGSYLTLSCNSGGVLSNGKCNYVSNPTYSVDGYWPGIGGTQCPTGSNYSYTDGKCHSQTDAITSCSKGTLINNTCMIINSVDATVNSKCPSGYTASSGQCIKTSNTNPSIKYSCPTGSNLKDGTCYTVLVTEGAMGYVCDDGYIFTGNQCVMNSVLDPIIKYSCSKIYTLNGPKCEKYKLLSPRAHYEDKTKKEK